MSFPSLKSTDSIPSPSSSTSPNPDNEQLQIHKTLMYLNKLSSKDFVTRMYNNVHKANQLDSDLEQMIINSLNHKFMTMEQIVQLFPKQAKTILASMQPKSAESSE